MGARMVQVGGTQLCAESFGDPGDPVVLLIMGAGASMLWWEEGFCRMVAAGGRFVIRYDQRDTGRSATGEPGHATYTGADMISDAAGVLDAYGIPAAQVVGVSSGGALAQMLALGHRDRVRALVLISTSPVTAGEHQLPAPTERFRQFAASATVDWADRRSVIGYLVSYARMLSGGQRPFDEEAMETLVRRDVERAHNIAASQNHAEVASGDMPDAALSSIAVPTLVIHGTADPMFPLQHGEALAGEIPDAELLRLDRAGHGLDRADWQAVAAAVLAQPGG